MVFNAGVVAIACDALSQTSIESYALAKASLSTNVVNPSLACSTSVNSLRNHKPMVMHMWSSDMSRTATTLPSFLSHTSLKSLSSRQPGPCFMSCS